MTPIRLGSVSYLNARPLVYGLERNPRFNVRYDIPAVCARLLHAHEIDLGLIPSIEYLRGPRPYNGVFGPGVTSKGPVASVAIYTRKEPRDIRSMAMDSTSRTSVALATILMRRVYNATLQPVSMQPDLERMLETADAALLIGDYALFLDHQALNARKIDVGEWWTEHTGLPFVYAFWAGWPQAVGAEEVAMLEDARDRGVAHLDDIARSYYPDDAERERVASGYLRHNIQYSLDGVEGLTTFYRYAAEYGLASFDGELRFYDAISRGNRSKSS
jgi:predicted solute-binding protein